MSNLFEGFDMGRVVRLRIRSYTVGGGGRAQLTAVELEVWFDGADEPEIRSLDYGDAGPSLAAVEALVAAVNRWLRERLDQGP